MLFEVNIRRTRHQRVRNNVTKILKSGTGQLLKINDENFGISSNKSINNSSNDKITIIVIVTVAIIIMIIVLITIIIVVIVMTVNDN